MKMHTRSAAFVAAALSTCFILTASAVHSHDLNGIRAVDREVAANRSLGANAKVEMCHFTSDTKNEAHGIRVSESAMDSHAAHGDYVTILAPEEICGDGFDNDCNGHIDEGCCPCWSDEDLLNVDSANMSAFSCSSASIPSMLWMIQNDPGSTPGSEGGFAVFGVGAGSRCLTRDYGVLIHLTPEEVASCGATIEARCAAVGDAL